ncbi:MAG: ATP-dependent helicase [Thermoplasmata archaeon]
MLYKTRKQHTKEEILSLMEGLVRKWFQSKFDEITEPQSYAVPLIHKKQNVLVSSPTGSGKTLTAFLSIINELYKVQLAGELEDKIYCVYISPLKALANDINKNLNEPLREMSEIAEKEGMDPPLIRVAVRSGDTSPYERQKMSRKPPHIFITTPESIALVLSTPKFSKKFKDVEYVIVDEIHEVCSSKRGVHLSLSLERLREQVGHNFVRIGLSATIAPMNEVAKFLAGYENGRLRDMNIIEVESRKKLDFSVLCPVKDMMILPFEIVNAKMYDTLKGLIDDHRTTLIFTNTRSGTEHVSLKLKERGVHNLAAHHGSLSKVTRLDVEERLKNGDLKVAVSSTSLELGIDIGYIDLVCQIGSPKSIAKGLQRIGRAGHAVGDISVGKMVVFDLDDLVECATIAKNAYDNKIDRVDMPANSLDVLAQSLVGMSLEKRWEVDDAFDLVRRSYSYHTLKKKDFLNTLKYLSEKDTSARVYGKIWLDEGRFGRKKKSRLIYFTNIGTIPEEGNYKVFNIHGSPLGDLSEKFVGYLKEGDVFVLGGRTYKFKRSRGMRIYVEDASGRKPTVPSWVGEMLPRSFDLSIEVGKFRRHVQEKLQDGEEETKEWLTENYRVDTGGARSIISYIKEQRSLIPQLPTEKELLIEGYIDPKGNRNIIFHFSFGRRVNDALSRAYAFALSNKLKCNIRVSVTDNNFMLTSPKKVALKGIEKLVTSDIVEDILRRALRNTELFKQRFRHCATRSFLVLRSYKGKEVSIGRQQLRSTRVMDAFHDIKEFPVIQEAYNEILNDFMDLPHAKEVLKKIESGEIRVRSTRYSSTPSPFAHNVILAGISDVVLMEDRSSMLRELHRQVLKRVFPESEIEKVQFSEERISAYFRRKLPRISEKDDILTLLEKAGAMNILRQKGRNIFDCSDVDFSTVRGWSDELIEEGKVESVWTTRGSLYSLKDDIPAYAVIFRKRIRIGDTERKILDVLDKGPARTKDIAKAIGMKIKEVSDTLALLERAYVVKRKQAKEILWQRREVEPADFEEALEHLVRITLGIEGPMSISELAYALGLEEIILKETLRELEERDIVRSGNFMIGEEFQYILSADLRALERKEERETHSEDNVKLHLMRKQLRNLKTIDEYFDNFLEVGHLLDIYNRLPDFDMEEWNSRRLRGDILHGRFLGGRVRFVRRKEAPLFVSAYRRENITKLDKEILTYIKSRDGVNIFEIAEKLKLDRGRAKASVEKLDRNMYIVRKFQPREGWTTKNVYIALEDMEEVKGARKRIVERFLRGYGPVPLLGIRWYTSFPVEEIRGILHNLQEEGVAQKIAVGKSGEREMWIPSDEVEQLGKAGGKVENGVRILSLYDPWVQPLWAQLSSRYGDSWYYPVLRDGDLLGTVEIWELGGCIEVRDIQLSNNEHIIELIGAIDNLMRFFEKKGYDLVKITGAFGKNILDIKELDIFLENGYHEVQDFIAKGGFLPLSFTDEEIMSYLLWKQRIHPDRAFENVLEAVQELGGLRSDFAARLRVRDPQRLSRMFFSGLVLKGRLIPDYQMFCTPEDLSLYKKAKNFEIDEYARMVLDVVRNEEPVKRNRLFVRSPLGYGNTLDAVRNLSKGLYITRAPQRGSYIVTVRSSRLSVRKARKKVIARIFENFGIFSAEGLATFTKFEFRMEETRRLLRELEDEGVLVKGFFREGSDTIYWLLRKDLDLMGNISINRRFVLTPFDLLFHYLRERIRAEFGMGCGFVVFDGPRMVGAFRARKKGDELTILEFIGDQEARAIVREFATSNRLWIREDLREYDDWEIVEWYERIYGKGRSG